MYYNKAFVAAKLRKWEKFLRTFRLPSWEELPEIELYMDQVIALLNRYLELLPPDEGGEKAITASVINNYVRMKVMPAPIRKRYTRVHLAYLIMFCSLKQNLSIAYISKMIPAGIPEEDVRAIYGDFVEKHAVASAYFIEQVRYGARHVLDPQDQSENQVGNLVSTAAVTSSLAKLLTQKLVNIQNEDDLSKL